MLHYAHDVTVLDAAFWVVSLVLLASGVTKLVDPDPLGRALVDLGVLSRRTADSGPLIGRVLGALEVMIGGAALAAGGRVTAVLVAVSYAVFTGIVVASWRRGLDSCGCFGSSSSPPGPAHVALNVVSSAVAVGAVAVPAPAVADGLEAAPWNPVIVVVLVLVGAVGVVAVDTR